MYLLKNISNFITLKTLFLDFCLISVICILPAFSHLLNFPLYLIEPMRLAVLFGFISSNKINGLFLAFSIPFFSTAFIGHPILIKSILISIEYLVMVMILLKYMNSKNYIIILASSFMVSKIIYYSLKFLFISFGIISGKLISVSIIVQSIALVPFILTGLMLSKALKGN